MTHMTASTNVTPTPEPIRRRRLALVGMVLLGTLPVAMPGCVSLEQIAPPVATLVDVQNPARLTYGRTLYLQRCSRCHAAPQILKMTPPQMQTVFPRMLDECKLSPADEHAIVAYVNAVRPVE